MIIPRQNRVITGRRMSSAQLPWVGLLTIVVAIGAISTCFDFLWLFYGAALSLAIIYAAVRGPQSVLSSLRAARPFYVFMALGIASYFWSIDPETTGHEIPHLLAFVGVFYIAHDMALRGKRAWLLRIAVIQSVVICLLFGFLLVGYGTVRVQRIDSPLNSFSNLGAAELVICLAFIAYAAATRRRARALYLLAGGIALMAIVLSASRGAYLSVLLLAIGAVMFSKRGKRRLVNALLISAVLAAVLAIAGSISLTQSMVLSVTDRLEGSKFLGSDSSSDSSISADRQRIEMYALLTSLFPQHPYLGVGYYAFGASFEEQTGKYMISHSLLITAIVEFGLLGTAVVSWLVVGAFRRARFAIRLHASHANGGFWCATFLALSVAIFEAQFRPQLDNALFFIVLALAFGEPHWVVASRQRRLASIPSGSESAPPLRPSYN